MAVSAHNRTDKGPPLYRRLAETLRSEISDGQYAVGSLLPTEQDLCERFDTSRYTVREALRLLMQDGLIERRQGRGTEVTSQERRTSFAQSLSSLSEIYAYAEDTVLRIDGVRTIVPDEPLAVQLGRAPGRKWLLAEGMRQTRDGGTICVARIYINTEFAGVRSDLKRLKGPIHIAVAERFGVDTEQVHQRIGLDRADPDIASALGVKPGEWTVLMRRRYLAADDQPILVSLNWHAGEEFSYNQIIRRD